MTSLLRIVAVILPLLACACGGEGPSTTEMSNSEFFGRQFSHLNPHHLGGGFYDVNLYQLYAVALTAVLFGLVRMSFAAGRSNWLMRVFRGWVHWLRDEVVYGVLGEEDGARFAPYFIYLFFFIAFLNLFGLIPGSVTATATVFVTGALALLTLALMVGGGMVRQGPLAYWKNLLPPGLPAWLIPLMAFVEGVGLLVKPFALMIRLFANMLAGHLLIYSFVGMIFVFAKLFEMGFFPSLAIAVPSAAMAIFINIIEAFIVLLQAYIFTYLSVLFVQMSLHPEH